MIKKIILMSLVVSQLTISCSSDDQSSTEQSLEEQIANIIKQPYSDLSPSDQKVKLEKDANEMLVQLDKTKNLSALETIENLNRLLDINTVDIFEGKTDNDAEDIINVSGVYGIYTWNNAGSKWVKSSSTTELKFIFPAKESQTANNASFSTNSTSSDIKVEDGDTFFLPTTAEAVLTIDNAKAATFTQIAKYSNGNEIPNEFSYKMALIDGYSWEMSSTKGTETAAKASFTYNGKKLIEFNSGSTANIDELLKGDALAQYRGKANGLITLMDNFVIVADMDIAAEASDKAALETNNPQPVQPDYYNANANFKAYYTAKNTYELKKSEGTAANYNKNMKLILVSKTEGTKIADIIIRSEKTDSEEFNLPVWDSENEYWSYNDNSELFTREYYDEVYYLRFKDNTEVEMGAYFSTGFSNFESKFEDFITSFEE